MLAGPLGPSGPTTAMLVQGSQPQRAHSSLRFQHTHTVQQCCLVFKETLLCSSLHPLPFVLLLGTTAMSLASSSLSPPIHPLSWVVYCQKGLYLIVFPRKSIPQKGSRPKKKKTSVRLSAHVLAAGQVGSFYRSRALPFVHCQLFYGPPNRRCQGKWFQWRTGHKVGCCSTSVSLSGTKPSSFWVCRFSPSSCCLPYLIHITFLRAGKLLLSKFHLQMQSSSTAGLNPHLARDSWRSWTQNHLWCRYTIWLVNLKALWNITAKTLVQEKWLAPYCPDVSTMLETIHFKWVSQYHKQKDSYHEPEILDSYFWPPRLTLQKQPATKRPNPKSALSWDWLQHEQPWSRAKAGAESPWAQQQLSVWYYRHDRPIQHHFHPDSSLAATIRSRQTMEYHKITISGNGQSGCQLPSLVSLFRFRNKHIETAEEQRTVSSVSGTPGA